MTPYGGSKSNVVILAICLPKRNFQLLFRLFRAIFALAVILAVVAQRSGGVFVCGGRVARISMWAQKFNVSIEEAKGNPGETIYRIRDLFTTRDGSWDWNEKPGAVPQWARDAYLKPVGHPQYNDDAGADHHLFGAVAIGDKLRPHGGVTYWTPNATGNLTTQRVKLHGWANIPIFASSNFVPERGERGPWSWQPSGTKADVVHGGGLPANQHVSFFAVWEAVTIPVVVDPEPQRPAEPPTVEQRIAALEAEVKSLRAIVSKWSGD